MRSVQTIVALMAIGVFLLAGSLPVSAAVLCMGADGHVEVEAATQGVCTSDTERGSDRNTATTAFYTDGHQDDHCGTCVDIPLGIGAGMESSTLAQSTRTEVDVPVASVLLEMSVPSPTIIQRFARGAGEVVPSPALVHLRSVTLHI